MIKPPAEIVREKLKGAPNDKKGDQATNTALLRRLFVFLWPLSPLILFYLINISLFTVFRAALAFTYGDKIKEVPDYLHAFAVGVRLDTVLLCYVLIVPALIVLACPDRLKKTGTVIMAAYCACLAGIFYFLEVATFPFMAEFGNRPDRIFLEHMVQFREVSEMILKGYAGSLCIALTGMALIAATVFMIFKRLSFVEKRISKTKRTGMLFCLVFLLLLGIRSNLSGRPVNISLAAFSESHLVNQLGFNSTYSLGYTFVQLREHGESAEKMYGRMPDEEILVRVRAANNITGKDCTNPAIPLLHFQKSGFPPGRQLNLVIILEESMGAEHVGCLGGLPITPNIDRLSREGMLFTNLYCTGTRTIRGVEAIISGFLPTPGESVLKSALGQQDFFTIAELLERRGYSTNFLYGGKSTFDNMEACFRSNGFENIYEQKDFKTPVFTATWGVSDEDLFARAHEIFKSQGSRPFFALVLTTSNHDPYEFPDGRIELYEQPKAGRYNTIKYADFALGQFFEAAKEEPYYGNTVFLVIADHGTRLRGQALIPIQKFHIPGFIIAPHLKPGRYEKTASQIDMTPTLLDIMGISTELPLIGRPLLSFPSTLPGRAVMQYGGTHSLMVDTNLVVQQPEKKPLQFTLAGEKLVPAATDRELTRDALAYALLPEYLALNKLHRLP